MEEYAEKYNTREAASRVILYVLIMSFTYIVTKKFFLPWLGFFINTAHCTNLWGENAPYYLSFSLLVGIPLFMFFVFLIIYLTRGRKIIAHQQYPPLGEKCIGKVKIIRGKKAAIRAHLMLLPVLASLLLPAFTYKFSFMFPDLIKEQDQKTCYETNS